MYGDGVSTWIDPKTKKIVVQVRITRPGQKPLKIQRRASSKREVQRIVQEIRLANQKQLRTVSNPTLTLVLAKYQDQKAYEVTPGTLANYMHLLGLYVVPKFGDRKVQSLEVSELTDFLAALRKQGLMANSVNTVRARFLDLLKFAVAHGYISRNPMADVKPHKKLDHLDTKVQKPWTRDEAKAAVLAFRNSCLDLFVTIAVTTGMRKGEILALKWSDIHPALDQSGGEEIRVNRSRGSKRQLKDDGGFSTNVVEGSTKTPASNRMLEINPHIKGALDRLTAKLTAEGKTPDDDQHLVLGVKGGPISDSTLYRTYNRVCDKAGLRRIRVHDCRHTAAVLGLEMGALLVEVSQGLGHSGVEITKRTYAPIVPGLTKRFTHKVSDALDD
jgi:integrase